MDIHLSPQKAISKPAQAGLRTNTVAKLPSTDGPLASPRRKGSRGAPIVPPRRAPLGYDGADLLEAFLCCFLAAQGVAPSEPRMAEARRSLALMGRHRKSPQLAGPCSAADLECCLRLCSPSAPAHFNDDTSLHLWGALKESLLEIEPRAIRLGRKSVPRTLDQMSILLESTD